MPPIQNLKSKIQNLKGRSINLHSKNNFLVGVISDTHGHLHPAVVKAFKNVDLIVHAGDIGKCEILETLQKIAPVLAVRGNMDGIETTAI